MVESVRWRGVEVPVLAGVEVPETLGVGAGTGSLGTMVVIVKETSPAAVGMGFAEYCARSMLILLYLFVSSVLRLSRGVILLTQPVSEGGDGVWAIPYQLTLCLSAMVLFSLAVAQDGRDLSVSIFVGDAFGHA